MHNLKLQFESELDMCRILPEISINKTKVMAFQGSKEINSTKIENRIIE